MIWNAPYAFQRWNALFVKKLKVCQIFNWIIHCRQYSISHTHSHTPRTLAYFHIVTGPKKSTEWTTCRACDDSYHLQCLNPPLEVRPNNWRCPSCKERKIKVKKEEKESKPLFKGEHNDDCFMCFNGGGECLVMSFSLNTKWIYSLHYSSYHTQCALDLLCCDYCEKAFHVSTLSSLWFFLVPQNVQKLTPEDINLIYSLIVAMSHSSSSWNSHWSVEVSRVCSGGIQAKNEVRRV